MPCYDSRGSHYPDNETVTVDNPETQRQLEMALSRNDELARMLCEICRNVVESKGEEYLSEGTRIWYAEHRQNDIRQCIELLQTNPSKLDSNDYLTMGRALTDYLEKDVIETTVGDSNETLFAYDKIDSWARAHIKAAERQKAYMRIIRKIELLNDGWRPNWETAEYKYNLLYQLPSSELHVMRPLYWIDHPYELYMKSIKIAEQVKEEHEQDYKIWLGVE